MTNINRMIFKNRRYNNINPIGPLWMIFVFLLIAGASHIRADDSATIAKLDRYFAAVGEQWQVPGMAIAIVKDNQVIFARGYGVRQAGGHDAVDANTLFAIASNTKAFTAAALAILVEEKKIDWDDRVIDYLPYFRLYDPYVSQDMRIRDLLCHRSGLATYSGDLVWYGTPYSIEEIIRRLRYLKADFPFRGGYGYSNVMFIAAGEVIARVSGQSYESFVSQRIIEPLKMARTVFSTRALAEKTNVAQPHKNIGFKAVPIDWYNWDSTVAAGGIISSVNDMARWLRLQLNRGKLDELQIFSEKSSQTMWTAQVALPVSKERSERYPSTHFSSYAMGWGLMDYLGCKVISHGGGYDGMYSRVALVPEKNLAMVILTNSMTSVPSVLMYKILDTWLNGPEKDWSSEYFEIFTKGIASKKKAQQEIEDKRIMGTKPSLDLQQYAGMYQSDLYGEIQVTLEKGALVLKSLPNPDMTGDLTHWHFDTFHIEWRKEFAWFGSGKVQFILDNTGKPAKLELDIPNEDFLFSELELTRKN